MLAAETDTSFQIVVSGPGVTEKRRLAWSPPGTNPPQGITLLELVMVLVAIGLILGFTIPLASALAGRFKVGSARDAFVSNYARARAAAVQFGRQSRLHLDAAEGRFWVEVDTGSTDGIAADTIDVVVDIGREYGGVTMYSNRQVLCFDSRGLPFTGGQCEPPDATVVFARSDRTDTVRTSLGGTVVQR